MDPRDQERARLEAFHADLASRDAAGQVNLLLNGYLPDATEILVEAGIRRLPLIQSGRSGIAEPAALRLQAVLFKLRQNPESTPDAVVQFEMLLAERRRSSLRDTRFGLMAMAGLLALLGCLAYFLARRFAG